MKRLLKGIILTIILTINPKAQTFDPLYKDSIQLKWVDEKYNSMTLEEKLDNYLLLPHIQIKILFTRMIF